MAVRCAMQLFLKKPILSPEKGSDMQDEKNEKETMDSIDPDLYKKNQNRYSRYDQDDANGSSSGMGSVDTNEGKGAFDAFERDFAPIEVKSTRHIELKKQEEARKEAIEDAHTAANEVFDWLESVLTAVVAIVLIFTFAIRINTVDGESMLPTLTEGQKLVVTDLFYTPAYNDIVIVQAANLDGGKPIVKRIVGLPGDTMKIDFESGTVYRNGSPLPIEVKDGLIYEDGHTINTLTTLNQDMISLVDYVVPDGCYFVLGDNRNNSKDSRLLSVIGFIDKNYIAGRAVFSVFPFDTFGLM